MVECHDSKNRNETFILRINVWTVNAVIAELVMQDVEMRAINTSPVSPKWWRRYVDDSSACLKRSDVQLFHQHINSINPYIQFTVELPTSTPSGESIALLDTKCTVRPEGTVNVNVHRKATHTNKYLSFQSHSPAQSKRAVVKTLMDRAKSLPSTESDRRAEKDRVARDLQANGYTKRFIECSYATPPAPRKPDERPEPRKGFATIPYVKGVSERIKKILNKANITTAFKPVRTLGTVFKKPKDRPPLVACKGIVANHAILRMLANQNAPGIHAGLNTSQGRAAVMIHS